MSHCKRSKRALRSLALLAFVLLSNCSILGGPRHPIEDYTPVFSAAENGDLNAVKQAVADDPGVVSRKEMERQTLLHDAAAHGRAAVVQYLLQAGADPNARTSDGLTPLAMAATNGQAAVVLPLLEGHADINAADPNGWTPLDRAEKWHHPDVEQLLVAHGALHGAQLRH
jgi:ankyrin repeat protein